MVAMGAKIVGSFSSFAVSQLKYLLRMPGLMAMAQLLTIPAILNVLEGAPKVMLISAAFSETVAKGMCR